jgi:hypothetical protein
MKYNEALVVFEKKLNPSSVNERSLTIINKLRFDTMKEAQQWISDICLYDKNRTYFNFKLSGARR